MKKDPGAKLAGVHASDQEHKVVLKLSNTWMTRAILMELPVPGAERDTAAEQREREVAAFLVLTPAPRAMIERSLASLGLRLDDVYTPPSPPYFTNGRGLVFDKAMDRYVLVARGVIDAGANRCFKAVVDVSSAKIVFKSYMQCSLR